jgi:glycerol-3-phosphate dehydrogenase
MRPTPLSPAQLPMLEPVLAQRLIGRYGEAVLAMLAQASEVERLPLAGTRFTLMELAWCLQQEAVVHLDDLLLRRTRLGNLLPDGGAALFDQIEPLCRQHLGWDAARWQAECSRYRALWQRSYSVPGQASRYQEKAGVLP